MNTTQGASRPMKRTMRGPDMQLQSLDSDLSPTHEAIVTSPHGVQHIAVVPATYSSSTIQSGRIYEQAEDGLSSIAIKNIFICSK